MLSEIKKLKYKYWNSLTLMEKDEWARIDSDEVFYGTDYIPQNQPDR